MLAINGLRDGNLKRELMATRGLDWEELTRLLKARSVTRLAVEELDEDTDRATPITEEVSVVYNNTKSSTHEACDNYESPHSYNIDSSHSNSYLGEAERNACSKHYHDSHDMSSSCRPPSNCRRQSHSRRGDGSDGKHESIGAERSDDFRSAFPYFHGRHGFSNESNSCWKSAKDHFGSSKSLCKSVRDYHRESPLRRDSIYKCYSREKQNFSRERYSRSSTVCYVCGRQDHYKKVCPEIECHKCYKKGECPLRESGYSSGRSSDRMRCHERRLKDRNRRPLYLF